MRLATAADVTAASDDVTAASDDVIAESDDVIGPVFRERVPTVHSDRRGCFRGGAYQSQSQRSSEQGERPRTVSMFVFCGRDRAGSEASFTADVIHTVRLF